MSLTTFIFFLQQQPIQHSCVLYCLNIYLTIETNLKQLDLCASSLLPGRTANLNFCPFQCSAVSCFDSSGCSQISLVSLVFLPHASSDVAPVEDPSGRPDCPRGCPGHSDDNCATLPANKLPSWEPRCAHTHTHTQAENTDIVGERKITLPGSITCSSHKKLRLTFPSQQCDM